MTSIEKRILFRHMDETSRWAVCLLGLWAGTEVRPDMSLAFKKMVEENPLDRGRLCFGGAS